METKRIPLVVDKGTFSNHIYIKSARHKLLLDTGTYFCMSSHKPNLAIGDADIRYHFAGDSKKGGIASWVLELMSDDDMVVPVHCLGLKLESLPTQEIGNWDFLIGLNFLANKKVHLDFDINGALKEGWIELNVGEKEFSMDLDISEIEEIKNE